MGVVSMSKLNSVMILLVAFLAVFFEASLQSVRHLLGAQVDLLPCLMVYAGLTASLPTVALLAALGGLWFDSLSANPLGVTVLPLFVIGFLIYRRRNLILHDQFFAQFILGLIASAVVPLLTLLLILTTHQTPLIGWGSLWQWMVMTVGGAVATPVCFHVFGWANQALSYRQVTETSFRPDREIQRGRK